ncbi:MAG: hypothetical protein ABI895_13645 [Deltaproteobacteria bacterium]
MNRSRPPQPASLCANGSGAGASWQRLLPMPGGSGAGALGRGSELEGRAHRCSCGSLLARLVAGGVELKCRRCKRIVLLPFPTEPTR